MTIYVRAWTLYWRNSALPGNLSPAPSSPITVPQELRDMGARWVRLVDYAGWVSASTGNQVPFIGELVFSLPTIGTPVSDVITGTNRWVSFSVLTSLATNAASNPTSTAANRSCWTRISDVRNWPETITAQFMQAPNWNANIGGDGSLNFRAILEFCDSEAYPVGV